MQQIRLEKCEKYKRKKKHLTLFTSQLCKWDKMISFNNTKNQTSDRITLIKHKARTLNWWMQWGKVSSFIPTPGQIWQQYSSAVVPLHGGTLCGWCCLTVVRLHGRKKQHLLWKYKTVSWRSFLLQHECRRWPHLPYGAGTGGCVGCRALGASETQLTYTL